MDIRFSCPKCEHHMIIDEAGAGMTVQCPKCGADAKVPNAPKPAAPSDSDKERTVAIKWIPPGAGPTQPKK
jgi:DNA-directed RNA polymerase subunit M/transcription elongation factor TFIIS